jgi:hypothetical protein
LRFGTLTDDLTKALNELTLKCSDTGRAGELTLKLTLKPGKAGQIEIVDDMWYDLYRQHKVLEDALQFVWRAIEAELGRSILDGEIAS